MEEVLDHQKQMDRIAADARRAIERERRDKEDFAKQANFGSWDEMKKSVLAEKEKELKGQLDDGDLTAIDPYINHKINALPELKELREMQARFEAQSAMEEINKDIRELNDRYPNCGVETIEDLEGTENGKEVIDIMANIPKGKMPLWKVWAAVNIDDVTSSQAAAQKASKDHLIKTGGSVGGSILKKIPANEYQTWKNGYPDASEEELQAKYNVHMNLVKKTGG